MPDRYKHYMPPEELINDILQSARELEQPLTRQQVIRSWRAVALTIEKYDQQEQLAAKNQQEEQPVDEENTEGITTQNMPGGMDGGSMSELSSDEDTGEDTVNTGSVGDKEV